MWGGARVRNDRPEGRGNPAVLSRALCRTMGNTPGEGEEEGMRFTDGACRIFHEARARLKHMG
ncbi:hypothetical protein J2129_001018 [Methanofollis sp. W23]|nr:hypothetical protein [Methanofollis sp. W23]